MSPEPFSEPDSQRFGILVDSSVWIEYYRPDGRNELRDVVTAMLRADRVATTPLVVAEVAQGAPDPGTLTTLLEDFEALHQLPMDFQTGARAARVGHALCRQGRATPFTDLMIAAAAAGADCELWHQDRHFSRIAEVTDLRERWFGEEEQNC